MGEASKARGRDERARREAETREQGGRPRRESKVGGVERARAARETPHEQQGRRETPQDHGLETPGDLKRERGAEGVGRPARSAEGVGRPEREGQKELEGQRGGQKELEGQRGGQKELEGTRCGRKARRHRRRRARSSQTTGWRDALHSSIVTVPARLGLTVHPTSCPSHLLPIPPLDPMSIALPAPPCRGPSCPQCRGPSPFLAARPS